MESFDIAGALHRLGELLQDPVLLIIGGGGAAILCQRIAQLNAARAHVIELYLQQGETP